MRTSPGKGKRVRHAMYCFQARKRELTGGALGKQHYYNEAEAKDNGGIAAR
jgi:hypothetical protein